MGENWQDTLRRERAKAAEPRDVPDAETVEAAPEVVKPDAVAVRPERDKLLDALERLLGEKA